MFKKNTIGVYLLMYMCMFILKIPLNPPQHVGVGGAWYECALYRINDMDCDSLLCYVKFRDIIQPNLSVHVFWQLTHVQLQLIQPLVQLLVCQSLSPLWCPSLWECWWLMFLATFQEGPKVHHTNQVHMLILLLCMMRWALIRRWRVMLWRWIQTLHMDHVLHRTRRMICMMCLDSCRICVESFCIKCYHSRLIYIVTSYLKCVLCNVLRQYQLPCSPCKAIMVSVDDRHDGRYLKWVNQAAFGCLGNCTSMCMA